MSKITYEYFKKNVVDIMHKVNITTTKKQRW